MSLYPTIVYDTPRTPELIGDVSTEGYTNVYIVLRDTVTGQLVNGNGIAVSWQINAGGVLSPVQTVNIIGSQALIYSGLITDDVTTGTAGYLYQFAIVGWGDQPSSPPGSAAVCDVNIKQVAINKKESAPGASDGQVIIYATSSQLPLSYSINGTNFQSSAYFEGLHDGAYTAYVSDAAGCTATYNFSMDALQSLLVADPSMDVGAGNSSRWNAAFNPIVFTYQRKDFEVTGIDRNDNGDAIITINADVTATQTDDLIYLEAGAYKGNYKVKKAVANQLVLEDAYVASDNNRGFININRLRPYYQVQTEIRYFDEDKNKFDTIVTTHRPNATGLVRADLSSFLQSLLKAKDDADYAQVNFRDVNLSASYTIRYAESWDGRTGNDMTWVSISKPYYVLYAARQLGDAGGGNMAPFVPFPSVNAISKRACWVTDFAEPAYSNGYPFDIGFIYSEALAGLNIYCELTELDINRQPITGSLQTSYLLNEDSSFLLNQDGSKLIIAKPSLTNTNLAQCIGLNRLLVNQTFNPKTAYFTLTLKYNDSNNQPHTITQTQTIRVDGMVDDQSVYLRWIGLNGSWNYYRFVYNQEVSLDVQNAVIIKNYVTDWATQDGIEQVVSKQAGQKMKVMAEDLPVADIKGLQSIKYSPKVQMLVGRNPIKWQTVVINTATFAEYETRNGQAPFSITFNLPGLNIQTQ